MQPLPTHLLLQVGWTDSDYAFTCMDYSSTLADLQDPAGNCTLVATGKGQANPPPPLGPLHTRRHSASGASAAAGPALRPS